MNTRRALAIVALGMGAVCAAVPARAALPSLALGVDAGTTRYDGRLADYQWDVAPTRAWGAQALAGFGPVALGARLSSDAVTQRLGIDGVSDPRVTATRLELVGRFRVVQVLGIGVHALASAGGQRLSYHPASLEIPTGGTPVTVALAPIASWVGGGGLALTHALPGPWRASAAVERRWFALDTAHTAGGAIVDGRETFGMWDARVGVDWLVTSR